MKSILTHAAFLLLMGVAAVPAHAQFERWPGALKQYELGYGLSWGSADYKIKLTGVAGDGSQRDTEVVTSVRTKGGFAGTVGTSLKLKRLGRTSTLALGVDLMYTAYLWDFNSPSRVTLSDSGYRFYYDQSMPFDGASLSIGLPLTADFKFGVDAMMDKHFRWGWTGGIGVIPSMSATTGLTGVDAGFGFGVQPILKSEVAVRAGIVMKLRLQYAFGKLTYMDYNGDGLAPGTKQQTQLIGKGNFTVSYIILPFSFMYKKSEWFNSY